jgi:polyferredoxin
MLFTLSARLRLDLSVQHGRNPVYVLLSDGSVRNNYTIKVRNMQTRPRDVTIRLDGLAGGVIWTQGSERKTAGQSITMQVAADSVGKVKIFVAAPAAGPEHSEFGMSVAATDGREKGNREVVKFERPAQAGVSQ